MIPVVESILFTNEAGLARISPISGRRASISLSTQTINQCTFVALKYELLGLKIDTQLAELYIPFL